MKSELGDIAIVYIGFLLGSGFILSQMLLGFITWLFTGKK